MLPCEAISRAPKEVSSARMFHSCAVGVARNFAGMISAQDGSCHTLA
jgi:hypothetical protein